MQTQVYICRQGVLMFDVNKLNKQINVLQKIIKFELDNSFISLDRVLMI